MDLTSWRDSATREAIVKIAEGAAQQHDDAEREFDYTTGADASVERAAQDAWTVVSIKRDWATVVAEAGNG